MTTRRYAEGTMVDPSKTRAEIERTLTRYGADGFLFGADRGHAVVAFRAHGVQVRFTLPPVDRNDPPLRRTPSGQRRTGKALEQAIDQEERRRWRALLLVIKAKLEVVESGLVGFHDEFLAHIALPDGRTFGDWAAPQVEEVYETGKMPALLPGTVGALPPGEGTGQ